MTPSAATPAQRATDAPAAPAGGLYLHLPFCRTVCPYCDFAVVRDRADAHGPYVDALHRALAAEPPPFAVRTLYLGGGTPSRLSDTDLAALVAAARPAGAALQETTLEANVEDLAPARLDAWRAAGIDRLSVGVQRLDAAHLKRLGRARSAAALAALPGLLARWRDLGGRTSIDLMYGLPGEDPAAFAAEVATVLAWPIEHLSAYTLTVEAGTPWATAVARGRLLPADDDAAAACYGVLLAQLDGAGWHAYEVSNFARPGAEAVHNRGYWQGRPYLGHGLGATSTLPGPAGPLRFERHRALADYLPTPAARVGAVVLGPEERALERLLVGLRSDVGVPAAALEAWRAGPGGGVATELLRRGLLVVAGERVGMPPAHRLLADEVARRWPWETVAARAGDMLDWP